MGYVNFTLPQTAGPYQFFLNDKEILLMPTGSSNEYHLFDSILSTRVSANNTLRVTVNNKCEQTVELKLNEALKLDIKVTKESHCGSASGEIEFQATGFTSEPELSFLGGVIIHNGIMGSRLTKNGDSYRLQNLYPGKHKIIIKDKIGCNIFDYEIKMAQPRMMIFSSLTLKKLFRGAQNLQRLHLRHRLTLICL